MTDTTSVSVDTGCTSGSAGTLVIGIADDLTAQLPHRFDEVHVDTAVPDGVDIDLRAALHFAVQHLAPGGVLVLRGPRSHDELVDELGLDTDPVDDGAVRRLRRDTRFTVHDLVYEARASIRRVTPQALADLLRGNDPPVVLDTRAHVDRLRHGVISGSIHVPRTVLEWHLDPAAGYRHPDVSSFDQSLVVVCDGGYSSSLAAASLVRIGFTDVSDLIGGHRAWVADGQAVTDPDHSHIDP